VVVADRAARATSPHRVTTIGPLHVIAALIGALTIWASARPLDDYDSFLHVELGGQILDGRIGDRSAWWLGVDEPPGWVTSQWLAEVIMHAVVTGPGWPTLLALSVLAQVTLVVGLGTVLLRGRPAPVAVPIFVLALAGTSDALAARPQTAGLLFLLWLAPACVRLWTTGRRPPIALIAMLSLIWAQLHGSWILAPAAFGLVALGLQLDAGRRPAALLRPALISALAAMTGVLNPQGLASFVLPLRFRAASSTITEWWPTTLVDGFTVAWAAIVVATVVVWARSGIPVPRVELLWVLGWAAFAMLGYRNVTPAVLMTAPVAVLALSRWYEQRRPGPEVPAPAGSREARLLTLTVALLLIGATAGALVRIPALDTFATTPGRRIAAWIGEQPGPVRVFNTWNATGALIGLSNGKARLVIDNRIDLWGGPYTARISDAESMAPGWERTVADFGPDAVVVSRDSALASGLTLKGWRIALTDRDLVLLLRSPGAGVPN
jgi:hypothetical protein